MLKVTIKFIAGSVFLLLFSCNSGNERADEEKKLRLADSLSESRIDSAYSAISRECDTLMKYKVPQMVNLLKKDSNAASRIFDSLVPYQDNDKKVEKVIRQLKSDCDANLLKETYKRWRLRQGPGPANRTKAKV